MSFKRCVRLSADGGYSPRTDKYPRYFPSIIFRHDAAFCEYPRGGYRARNFPFAALRTGGTAHRSNCRSLPGTAAPRCIRVLLCHTSYCCFHCCRSLRGSSSFPPSDSEYATESRCTEEAGISWASSALRSSGAPLTLRQDAALIINKKLKTEITFFIILRFKSDPGAGLYR